jgi:acetyl-CoA carboxylase biotin carboxyl carrier protein
MSLSTQEIREILAILEASGWDEAQVQIGDVTVSVSKSGNGTLFGGGAPGAVGGPPAPAEVPAPADVPAPAAAPGAAAGHVVESPSVGVFWRSPEPGAPPFVEVGAAVSPGDTLCIVEVMKLMQHVVADLAGTVSAIHVANGDQVEFGTPLFSIAPGP